MPSQVFTQGPAKRTALQDLMGNQVQSRIQGNNPVLQNQFAQQDQATAPGVAQARQDATQPGMFGQGRATRGAQQVQQSALQAISGNKLNQAGLAAKDVQDATTQGMGYQNTLTAEDQANRNFAYNAAKDTGDAVGMAGQQQAAQGQQGLGYTAYGEQATNTQAAQAKADADEQRRRADEEYAYTQEQRRKAAKSSRGGISGMLGSLGNIASIVPGYGTAIGSGLKGAGTIASLMGK